MKNHVLITGSTSGIGLATAQEFIAHGWKLILVGRSSDKLNSVRKSLGEGETEMIVADLADAQAGAAIASQYLTQGWPLHCLINNAGIFARHEIDDLHPHLFLQQMQVNFFSPVSLTNHLIPLLKAQKNSSIVNVSSTLGLKPTAETSAYSASKAALINWTQSLALGLAPFHIRANVVCPGIVETPIHGLEKLSKADKQNYLEQMNKAQPIGRVGQPKEIAKAIYFLASESSAWTTGATLAVDGGISLA